MLPYTCYATGCATIALCKLRGGVVEHNPTATQKQHNPFYRKGNPRLQWVFSDRKCGGIFAADGKFHPRCCFCGCQVQSPPSQYYGKHLKAKYPRNNSAPSVGKGSLTCQRSYWAHLDGPPRLEDGFADNGLPVASCRSTTTAALQLLCCCLGDASRANSGRSG